MYNLDERIIRGLADQFLGFFYDNITLKIINNEDLENFTIKHSERGFCFNFILKFDTNIENGKIFHTKDKQSENCYNSIAYVNPDMELDKKNFIIAHEYSHWINLVMDVTNNKYRNNVSERIKKLRNIKAFKSFNSSKLQELANKLFDLESFDKVIPDETSQIIERTDMTKHPICALSRLLIMPSQIIREKLTSFENDISKTIIYFLNEYKVPRHVSILRMFDENMVSLFT